MTQEQIAQLFGYALAAIAVLIGLGSVLVDRLKVKNKRDEAQTKIVALQEEVRAMQEKEDLKTRQIVNESLREYREENARLRNEQASRELNHSKKTTELQTQIESLEESFRREQMRTTNMRKAFIRKNRDNLELISQLRTEVDELTTRLDSVTIELATERALKEDLERRHALLLSQFDEALGKATETETGNLRQIVADLLKELNDKATSIQSLTYKLEECEKRWLEERGSTPTESPLEGETASPGSSSS